MCKVQNYNRRQQIYEAWEQHIKLQEELCQRLNSMEKSIRLPENVTLEEFLKTIEVIIASEHYNFTSEQNEPFPL